MFTLENTEGFDQETLDKMNTELEQAIAGLDESESSYDSEVQAISNRIFNKYC